MGKLDLVAIYLYNVYMVQVSERIEEMVQLYRLRHA